MAAITYKDSNNTIICEDKTITVQKDIVESKTLKKNDFSLYTSDILINHVQKSIKNAERGISKLSKDVLGIDGLSSSKVRHFLNNICSIPGTNYLEIGVW